LSYFDRRIVGGASVLTETHAEETSA
jgi:hypothetical protein